jgi:hypothetical protein
LLTPFCIIYQLKPPRMSSGCSFVNLLYFDLIYYIAVGKRNLHCCPILAYFSTSTLISMNNPLGLSCSSRYLIIIPVVIFSLKSTNYKRILIEGGRYQTHTRKTSFYENKYWIISLIIIVFIPSHQNLSSYICPWLFVFFVFFCRLSRHLFFYRTWHISKRQISRQWRQSQTSALITVYH